jgi:hypothetical protein
MPLQCETPMAEFAMVGSWEWWGPQSFMVGEQKAKKTCTTRLIIFFFMKQTNCCTLGTLSCRIQNQGIGSIYEVANDTFAK